MSDTSSESVSIAIGKSFGRLEALRMAARKFEPEERDLDEATTCPKSRSYRNR